MPEGSDSTARQAAQPPVSAVSAAVPATHRRRWVLVMLGALVVIAIGLGYSWLTSSATSLNYATVPVTRGDLVRSVTASGTVNPVNTIQVGSYISGVVQTVACDFNDAVKAGQLCAKIDPRPFQSTVDQADANLNSARAQRVKDQANLAYTKAASERTARLVQQGIVSQDIADSAKNAYDQARADVTVDEATIVQRQAALDAAKINLNYTDILSPVDGTVVSRNVTVGQTVASTLQSPTLFLISTDLTKMQVDANVSESDIGPIKEDDRATFTVQAFPGIEFNGVVSQVRQVPITLQNVVTYDVVVNVDNPDLLLKPGMTATARIITAERNDVLRVSDQALHYTPTSAVETATNVQSRPRAPGQNAFGPNAFKGPPQKARTVAAPRRSTQGEGRVYVLRDGEPVAVPITVGLDDDANAEVLAGDLKEGDKVIVSETRTSGGATSVFRLPRF